ncbi:ArgE/DapE family deacylase [Staphylococcus caprae]|uniref:ArgE/DapE family deacylase n=1 Tax=Staphylococcus caprae TaxID=29380 RepID=UPI001C82CD3E|nr:ArgE/DapE family deacylase [Staphylococcus caprae]MBX5320299.1 ArgE/DapE family deacylase [Staphylococcus caprae]MDI9232105.1 ArgE/DapE family deacylase [Staphylococcus caprae]MEB8095865.1 ArgE/DapE family deacylase [Staphylococcus caprae]
MRTFSEEERIEILSKIVSCNTVNGNEIEVAQYLKELFKKHDIDVELDYVSNDRPNLIATIGSGKPVVGLSGHMDVVSEGNKENWKYNPFELTEKDGKLYGRGTSDMKSGLTALAISLIEIKENYNLEKGTIKFIATVGEEKEQFGSQQVYENGYVKDLDALIIAEPSETTLVYGHKGSMNIRITSNGSSCHSSAPFLGQNALKPLLKFIKKIEDEYEDNISKIKSKTLDFSNLLKTIENNEIPGVNKETIYNNVSGPIINNTIINGGSQVNSIPEYATAEFNIRTIPEYNNDKVKELFQNYLDQLNDSEQNYNLSMDIDLDLDPVITTGENDLISLGIKLGQEHFDTEITKSPTVGVTDASNLLRNKEEGFPFLMLGPGSEAHQTNESVDKNMYLNFIDYYIKLILAYLSK